MFNIGKKRSKYGQFLDNHKIMQERIREETGLNKDTLTKACNNEDYKPRGSVAKLLLDAARKLSGENVTKKDFWM